MSKFKQRLAKERGTKNYDWLHARFTFSFADYYDPEYCGFHSLIVMNNDTIQPKGGFGRHPHDNAEIFTYVISGELEHQDSMGNGSVIKSGNLQYMSAGDGVFHSEFNPSTKHPTELYQIWMQPNQEGGPPLYSEKKLKNAKIKNELKILYSIDEREGSSPIRQNVVFNFGKLEQGYTLEITPECNLPHAWIQVISGSLSIGDFFLNKADGLGIENIDGPLSVEASEDCDFFLFQLPE